MPPRLRKNSHVRLISLNKKLKYSIITIDYNNKKIRLNMKKNKKHSEKRDNMQMILNNKSN